MNDKSKPLTHRGNVEDLSTHGAAILETNVNEMGNGTNGEQLDRLAQNQNDWWNPFSSLCFMRVDQLID